MLADGSIFNIEDADYILIAHDRIFAEMQIPILFLSAYPAFIYTKDLSSRHIGEKSVIAAGHKYLHIFYRVKNEPLSSSVQLGHYIIEEHNGIFALFRLQYFRLRQLES